MCFDPIFETALGSSQSRTSWANSCGLEGFTVASIKKDAYICSYNFIGDIVFTLNHVHYNLSSSWLSIHGANYITFLYSCYLENNPSSNDIIHMAVSCLVII